MILRASPAKVNLTLRVLGRREDGYHDILSLMQKISLCDEMAFLPREAGITVRCPDSPLPVDDRNIAHRAAAAFLSRAGVPAGVAITIRKRIPIAAGLGGGSSNAATTLMALNEMAGNPLGREELMGIGAKLGADVPFFMFGSSAWAVGVGDRLAAAPPLPPLWFVLVNPGFPVSTRMVYQSLNFALTKPAIRYSIPRFFTVEDLLGGLINDLESVTVRRHPVLDHIKTLLLENGARGALMSGSGPTVFGIFTDAEQARRAEDNLGQLNRWSVFGAHSL